MSTADTALSPEAMSAMQGYCSEKTEKTEAIVAEYEKKLTGAKAEILALKQLSHVLDGIDLSVPLTTKELNAEFDQRSSSLAKSDQTLKLLFDRHLVALRTTLSESLGIDPSELKQGKPR